MTKKLSMGVQSTVQQVGKGVAARPGKKVLSLSFSLSLFFSFFFFCFMKKFFFSFLLILFFLFLFFIGVSPIQGSPTQGRKTV